jgi:peptidoglycan hydrolase CwlO-like protein
MEKKTYIFVSGKHTDSEGNTYKKGDRIELTEDEAKGLVNKIVDLEASFGVSVSADTSSFEAENARLKERIAELELEVEELKEAIEGDD